MAAAAEKIKAWHDNNENGVTLAWHQRKAIGMVSAKIA